MACGTHGHCELCDETKRGPRTTRLILQQGMVKARQDTLPSHHEGSVGVLRVPTALCAFQWRSLHAAQDKEMSAGARRQLTAAEAAADCYEIGGIRAVTRLVRWLARASHVVMLRAVKRSAAGSGSQAAQQSSSRAAAAVCHRRGHEQVFAALAKRQKTVGAPCASQKAAAAIASCWLDAYRSLALCLVHT